VGKISDAIDKAEGIVHLDSTVPNQDTGYLDQQIIEKRKPQLKPTEIETAAAASNQLHKLSESYKPQPPLPPSHIISNPALITYHAPYSFEAEQFRKLRTNILFPKGKKEVPRVILTTSALPGEGKTFVSANLATTIAQNIDKHVLLMDCDMRRPAQHSIFNLPNDRGLSNFLIEGTPLSKLLIKVVNDRLSLLRCGPLPDNPAELLSSNRMAALLQEVRSRYQDRIIIIDSPPPQLTAESIALAKNVDGILMVVKMGYTQKEVVSDLVSIFGRDKIIGVVANWMPKRSINYGSRKYYQDKSYAPKSE
jgi:capsular exopolysaccharide synthesis family protein